MKLNQDCVRQVLLDIESNLDVPPQFQDYKNVISPKTFDKYGDDDVVYSLLKLKEAGYIDAEETYASNQLYWFNISSITWDGHKFLDNVRDPKAWKMAKSALSHLESVSIDLVSQTASAVISNLISKNF